METRRSSGRLKNKSPIAYKRKSESPEPEIEATVSIPRKKKRASVTPKSSIFEDPPIEDKLRHDSIEEFVSGAGDLNLSSDSDSEDSSDEREEKKIQTSVEINILKENPPCIEETVAEETSEYFDFSKILSKQNSIQHLLGSLPDDENSTKIELDEDRHTDNETETPAQTEIEQTRAGKTRKSSRAKPDCTKSEKKQSRESNKSKTLGSGTDEKSHKTSSTRKSKSKNDGSEKKVRSKEESSDTKVRCSTDGDLNVKDLLAIGEGVDTSELVHLEDDSDDTKEDYKIPENIEITLDLPGKKKKKGFDLEAALKRKLNTVKKENQVLVHKVHLLCLLSHGFHLNKCLNNENLIAIALSLIPTKQCYPPKHADISYLERFMSWFCKKIKIEDTTQIKFNISCSSLTSHLMSCFSEHKAGTKIDIILMFITVLRSLGLKCRLMINMQPVPLKPSSDVLFPLSLKPKSEADSKSKPKSEADSKAKRNSEADGKTKPKKEKKLSSEKKNEKDSTFNKKSTSNVSKYFQPSSQSESDSPSKYFKNTRANSTSSKDSKRVKTNSNTKSKSSRGSALRSQPSSSKSNDVDYITEDESEHSDDSDFEPRKSKSRSSTSSSRKTPNKSSTSKSHSSKSSSVKSSTSKSSSVKSSANKSSPIDRKVLSSESETEVVTSKPEKKKGLDVWCEVFLEAEEKWFSVDIVNKRYHCVEKLYSGCTHPVCYVLAWNNDNTVKDLTKRYAPQWLTTTQKLRVEPKWWRRTLKPFVPGNTVWEREENEELEQALKDMPLPLSVSEYKNHPLYVLAKDLLKFQGIYPADVTPAGYFKGEKVYPRSAVKELHTRETWLKEARVVKLGEKPYKVVKARVKRDKFGFLPKEEKKSELFGYWQTEEYVPPTAQDGKVPRNAFGNVDLFLESMLPVGTVHLRLPQLQRIARKLDIDVAPAMVGFEPCRFGSRPVMDGWIVCEEFEETLIDAWNQEFDEKTRREEEKTRKRAIANWKKLLRCWRIRKRLQKRYGRFKDKDSVESKANE